MSKKTLICYNSILSFLIWIIKDTTLQKECEISYEGKNVFLKTDKYYGKLSRLNRYFILTVKYFLPILAVLMLFVLSTHIIEAFFIYGFPFVLLLLFFLIYFREKQFKIFTIIFTFVYLVLLVLIILKYNLHFLFIMQLLFNSLHIFLCYLILFKIYKDFQINRNRKFYFDKKNKLIISVCG